MPYPVLAILLIAAVVGLIICAVGWISTGETLTTKIKALEDAIEIAQANPGKYSALVTQYEQQGKEVLRLNKELGDMSNAYTESQHELTRSNTAYNEMVKAYQGAEERGDLLFDQLVDVSEAAIEAITSYEFLRTCSSQFTLTHVDAAFGSEYNAEVAAIREGAADRIEKLKTPVDHDPKGTKDGDYMSDEIPPVQEPTAG